MGSCYSTDRLTPAYARSLNSHQSNRPLDRVKRNQTLNSREIERERLVNHSSRSLRKSLRKELHSRPFSSIKQRKSAAADLSIDDPLDVSKAKTISIYSELPLINLSQSQTTSELEEYDNSSINISEYHHPSLNGNTIAVYSDTKVIYPFPIHLNTSASYECKIYNRIDRNTLVESRHNRASYHESRRYTTSSSMNNSSSFNIQNSSSESSFSYSNSVSPQDTLNSRRMSQNTKPSMLQQPTASKINRFGFKPGIPTSQPQATVQSLNIQHAEPQKLKRSMNSASSDAVTLPISNQLNKLHIDEPKQNQLKVHSAYKRKDPSPHLSFLKAPAVSVSFNNENQSKNKSVGLTTKQLEATNKLPSKQKMLQESSSFSSLSSSTSVSSFNQKKQSASNSDMRKSISSESSTSRKSGLPNPKVSIKSPTASKASAALQTPQKSTTSPRIKSPLQFQSNLIKPPTVSANSISSNQHKRRLFNPYVPSSSLSTTKANDTKNNPIDINNNVNETISPKEKQEPTGEVSNTDKAHKFKIYNNKAGTNVSKINVIQAFKTSKMLQKPNAAQTKKVASKKTPEITQETQAFSSSIYREKPSTGADSLGGTFVKRGDSAYCSSTSSTVSSQDVELGKIPTATEEATNLSRVKSTEISNQDEVETTKNTTVETPTPTGSSDTEENTADIKPGELTNVEKQTLTAETTTDFKSRIDELNNKLDNNIESILNNDSGVFPENQKSLASSGSRSNTLNRKLSKQNSIKESVSELGQLMSTSSLGLFEEQRKLRRTSSTSLANVSGAFASSSPNTHSPMFKPPSNLKPAENSEVIELDIDTYRMLLQDLQNTKTILHKLVNVLREPSANSFNNNNTNNGHAEPGDYQMDDFQMTSSFYGCLTQFATNDKIDQTTQTE